jgi:hypothetical protein
MRLVLRLAGAALLVVVGVVHLYLWDHADYRDIATIGPLFMLTVVVSFVLALALVVRGHVVLALAGALFCLATLGAYVISLTVGIFNFSEPSVSTPGAISIAAEGAGALVLLAWVVVDHRQRRRLGSGRASAVSLV